MTKRLTVLAALTATMLLAMACKKSGEGPPPGKTDGAITKATPAPAKPPAKEGPIVAPAPPPGNTCFSSCLRQYAVRAVSADQNDKDCRARCERECVDPCKQRTAMRKVSADQINADCRSSCGL